MSTQQGEPLVEGAVQTLVRDGAQRRRFLAAAGAAGASFGVFALAACGGGSKKPSTTTSSSTTGATQTTIPTHSTSDAGILTYLLSVEELLVAFYEQATAGHQFSGEHAKLLQDILTQERLHVAALRGELTSLHGAAPTTAVYHIPRSDAKGTAALAYQLENHAAAAYLGQAANFQSTAVLALALTIHTVEARHAATLANISGLSATPDGAIAQPEGEQEVLSAMAPLTG